jgi:hypothetical protein
MVSRRGTAIRTTLAFMVVSLVLSEIPSHADPRLHRTCTWMHDLKAVGIAGHQGGVLEACGINGGPPVLNTIYDAPHKDGSGLCTIRERYIGLQPDAAGRYAQLPHDPLDKAESQVEILPPPTPARCPDAADGARYLLAGNISDGVFLELLGLWRSIDANPSRLDALAERVPAEHRVWMARLKDDLAKRTLSVTAIGGAAAADARADGQAGRYEMIVRYTDDFDDWYELGWDRDREGLKVVDIQMAAD